MRTATAYIQYALSFSKASTFPEKNCTIFSDCSDFDDNGDDNECSDYSIIAILSSNNRHNMPFPPTNEIEDTGGGQSTSDCGRQKSQKPVVKDMVRNGTQWYEIQKIPSLPLANMRLGAALRTTLLKGDEPA